MSNNTTIIKLHDFITIHNTDQFSHLDSMLKNKFRSPPNIPFSLRMNALPALTPPFPINVSSTTTNHNDDDEILDVWYDVVISYQFNSIIVSGTGNIQVFDYHTKKHLKKIEMKDIEIHELEIDKCGSNLYLSGVWRDTGTYRVAKYNLQKLLNDNVEKSCLWISNDKALTNLWGIGLFEFKNETFVYAMDYSKGLTAFDSKTGQIVDHIMPSVSLGYGVTFTPGNEMIITSAQYSGSPVSVYTFNDRLKQWNLKKSCPRSDSDNTPYGVFYEIATRRIFVTDTVARSITGFDLHSLKRVFHHQFPKEMGEYYGVLIDNRTGIMYLPDVNGKLLCFD